MSHRGRTLRTPERKAAFLRLLRDGNAIGPAAAAIGCQRRTVYDWRDADPSFRRDWDEALDHQTEVIEHVVYQRALAGDLFACCVWLRAHKPSLYHRRQLVSIEGDIDHQHRMADDGENGSAENVHFFMPDNRRHLPDTMDDDPEAPVIEGEAEVAERGDEEAA
jgi:hypothetical protein